MSEAEPFHILLDSNVWITERLLQSAIGSALLYAVASAKASIVLPEVVELEVNRVVPELAKKAVAVIGREASLLRQLSGHNLFFTGPSAVAIKDGIKDRWEKLGGVLVRIPFTHEQARSALSRVIRKGAPSGDNNEQFRDCCIWHAALSAASDRTVHLVTADSAFYEGRNRGSGLASSLLEELRDGNKDIRIYPALRDFLTATSGSTLSIYEKIIGQAIVQAVMGRAHEIAADKGQFELGVPHKPKISGYATPKPSLIAISFEVLFDLRFTDVRGDTEDQDKAELSLKGVCSYDPNNGEISEIEVREWSTYLKGHRRGWSTTSPDQVSIERQYGPSRMRVVS